MKTRYCPDCGAENRLEAESCHECNFPLKLMVEIQGNDRILITGNEAKNWRRMADLLRRNGISIKNEQSKGLASHQLWWFLPGLGAMIFLATLIFGGPIADSIWEPAPQQAQRTVLDLNDPDGDRARARAREARENDPRAPIDESGVTREDVEYLADAFRTTEEQQRKTGSEVLDLEQFVDRIEVSQSKIVEFIRDSDLAVEVEKLRGRGTLLNDAGFFFMPAAMNADAFKRQTRLVSRDGRMENEDIFVVPRVSRDENLFVQAERIATSQVFGIDLMRARVEGPISYEVDFDNELDPSRQIWIGHYSGGRFNAIRGQITESYNLADNRNVWLVNPEIRLDRRDSGSPVFDETGKLAGIYIFQAGQDTVVSFRTIRERAPRIFKEIQ